MLPGINELGRLYMTNHEYVSCRTELRQEIVAGRYRFDIESRSLRWIQNRNFSGGVSLIARLYGALGTMKWMRLVSKRFHYTLSRTGESNQWTNKPTLPTPTMHKIYWVPVICRLACLWNAECERGGACAPNTTGWCWMAIKCQFSRKVDNPTLQFFHRWIHPIISTKTSFVWLMHTINRPEFREVSPLSYYDFTEKKLRGNPALKDATIQISISVSNITLRPTKHLQWQHFTNTLAILLKW